MIISALKINRINVSNDDEANIVENVKDKLNVHNAATLLLISSIFKLPRFQKVTFAYVERCFTMVSETNSFLELDLTFAKQIFSSSYLNVTSELEVFKAADSWINYREEKRINFAKDILLTVRLHLLSKHALEYIFNESLSFNKVKECLALKNCCLRKKDNFFDKNTNVSLTNRYCSQYSFNMLIFNPYYYAEDLIRGKLKLMDKKTSNCFKLRAASLCKGSTTNVVVNGDVYFFNDNENFNDFITVEKYSLIDKNCREVAKIKRNRSQFCVCGLIDKTYVIGGYQKRNSSTNSCIQFDTKNNKWNEVSRMSEPRVSAACTVFQGRVVVSGGFDVQNGNFEIDFHTVEMYDHTSNSWSYMPQMNEARSFHGSVAIRNKIFVVGGLRKNTCEVFDTVSNRFVLLVKTSPVFKSYNRYQNITFLFGNKVAMHRFNSNKIMLFDIETEQWSEKSSKNLTYLLSMYLSIKVPTL